MANYLFQDNPAGLTGQECVYAILYNPITLEIFNPSASPSADWVAINTVPNASSVAVVALAYGNTGLYYIEVPTAIENDEVLAKWFIAAACNSKSVTTDVPIGSSSYSPPLSSTTISSGDITAIAQKVLTMAISAAGTLDKHSLGAAVAALLSGNTTEVKGKLTTKNPGTGATLFTYDIETGHGQPIRKIS